MDVFPVSAAHAEGCPPSGPAMHAPARIKHERGRGVESENQCLYAPAGPPSPCTRGTSPAKVVPTALAATLAEGSKALSEAPRGPQHWARGDPMRLDPWLRRPSSPRACRRTSPFACRRSRRAARRQRRCYSSNPQDHHDIAHGRRPPPIRPTSPTPSRSPRVAPAMCPATPRRRPLRCATHRRASSHRCAAQRR